ncbi:MAG: LPS-assembly protein LptD, partial [Chitinophagaceae bacterium]
MKLLLNIIFFGSIVLLVFSSNRALAYSNLSFQQDTTIRRPTTGQTKPQSPLTGSTSTQSKPKDTVASEKVEYKAKDSTVVDKTSEIVYLYGEARVMYQGFELDADYIEFNTKTNLVYARGRTNGKGKYVGRPILK